jgi:hypothetical protein
MAVRVENPDVEAVKLINHWGASLYSGRGSRKAGKEVTGVLDFRYI